MATKRLIDKLQGLLREIDPEHRDHDVVTAALAALVKMEGTIAALERQFGVESDEVTEIEKKL